MADYNLNAEITADASGFESGIKKAQKASKNLSKSVSSMVQGLGKNGLVGALGAVGLATGGVTAILGTARKAFQAISKTVNECAEAYRNQYKAEVALETAVKNNPYIDGSSLNGLKQFAGEMQRVSEIGDEQFLPMMAQLIATGRTEAETMDIIKVATDMSATGTMSFETAIQQLNATLNGNIGRLGQQNSELKNLTEEELKSGKAVEILGNKFKGLAEATADTSKQLKNALGDLKENLGRIFETALAPMRKFFTEVISNLNDVLTKSADVKKAMKDVFSEENINIEAPTDSLQIALDEVLKKQREVTANYSQYIQLYGKYIDQTTDETVKSYKEQISDLNRQIKTLSEELIKRRKESDAQAKARKEAEANAKEEKQINDLKEKYLKLIAEQEAKWTNIKKVTGEAVKNEERLKFYQEQLVAIMTESGGKITENNQYYKDQMAIIEKLIALIKGNAEVVSTSYFSIFGDTFKALTEYVDEVEAELNDKVAKIKKVADIVQKTFANAFKKLGEEIAQGGISWKSYAKIALEAIAEVLEAIAKELTAIAVVKVMSEDYAKATIALAGATASLIGAGALTATASHLDKVTQSAKETSEAVAECTVSFENMQQAVENIAQGFTKTPATLFSTQAQYRETIAEYTEIVEEAWDKYFEVSFETASVAYKIQEIQDKIKELNGHTSLGTYGIAMFVMQYTTELWELEKQYKALSETETAYGEDYREKAKILKEAQEALAKTTQDVIDNFKKQSDTMIATARAYKELYANTSVYSEIVGYEQRSGTNKLLGDYWSNLANTGKTIGETFVKSIVNGATETDFAGSIKNYLREQMIKISVYTEELSETFAQIGTQLSSAIVTGDKSAIGRAKESLSNLYKEAVKKAKEVGSVLDEIFGDVAESIEESIDDMGTSIADTLVNSMSEGLDQSSFLDSIKKWIRKLLIQTVVYTESMKAEIEAIGQSISKALSEGFTETNFHEIRRDLSWVFNEANNTMSNLDNILNNVFGGYATGTNNAVKGLHLVGEAGPELVRFRGGEQVLNNHNTQKALEGMGGTTINQNVTFNNLQDTTAYAMMNQFKQYNRSLAINGVI